MPVLLSSAAWVARMGSTHSIINSLTCSGALPTKREGSSNVSRDPWTAELSNTGIDAVNV